MLAQQNGDLLYPWIEYTEKNHSYCAILNRTKWFLTPPDLSPILPSSDTESIAAFGIFAVTLCQDCASLGFP